MSPEQQKLIEETVVAAKLDEEKKEELRRELISHFGSRETSGATESFGSAKNIARELNTVHDANAPLRRFYYVLTAAPALAVIFFYGYVLRAFIAIGRWPTPYNPDPMDLGFTVHSTLVLLLEIFAVSSCIPWIIASVMLACKNSMTKNILFCVATYSFFFALFIFLARIDPGNFYYWFAD